MKHNTGSILLVYTATLLFSCKKQSSVEINKLYGNWRLIQIYDEWGGERSRNWNAVSSANSEYLLFTVTGRYKRVEGSSNGSGRCSGTYRFLSDTDIEINSDCNPEIEKLTISILTKETLIIDRLSTEGIVRYKYTADKQMPDGD